MLINLVLCARLWRDNKLFNATRVTDYWHQYAIEEKSTVFKELESLSANQLKLLMALARFGSTSAPAGDRFLSFAAMSLSSARQSFKVLQERDYIYQNKQQEYSVLDPLIDYVLSKRPMESVS